MPKSLADQLLKAGLVDQKKVKQAQKEQRQQNKQPKQKKGAAAPNDTQLRIEQQRAEKAERDRQLNLQRVEAERQKAMRAQVKQMLEHSGIKTDGEVRFNFTDPNSKKIKQVYVSQKQQDQLAAGLLAICSDGSRYVVVPATIADKIAERFAEAVIFRADQSTDATHDDDPYKDYPIPDDLMW
ncbi:MAG TPA: DUF2058 domain-containing protein [Pseudohongiella sp.]|nr:nucleoprotein/polynucleotide-associated enzyme [Pseudohongiella sp.]MAY55769.1 nucleoprotein/polynucleotide-associated enzyme [Gammaproteobacteria bacterium]MBJ54078.1 nucleoprotein/polynucleotide-associated enzyme [Gammaproteobacteria bacterium]HBN14204.1 DUF2058 domain-containing protein [Pseudohongiella sp.]HBX36265.1 DUF2058 domain-containing protein [Pseudohongiella sp.]|tara:strand:+ start:13552 stop:14100 length:549 start_codon:yes stop_codon:yes gene_type:complete